MWREVKKREEKRSTPAFFSFFTSRPPLWGSQGAGPLGRASRAIGSSGHLFRFLFGCPKRKDYRKYAMILEGLPQGGNPDAAININFFQNPLDLKPMFNATLVAETNQVRDTCHG